MRRDIYEPDHDIFRSTCKQFVEKILAPRHAEMLENKALPRDIWRTAGEYGLLGLAIPEAYGGAGVDDFRFNAVLAEEVAAFSVGVAACLSIHSDVCPPYLVEMGTDEQKQRWLPGLANGELVCSIGMTEPSGGSDLAALKTTAKRDGDGWIINGAKTFITLFVIEAGTPGFERGRKLDKVGQDEADTAELFFADVRIGDENRLGDLDTGFTAMMNLLPQERLATSVTNIGSANAIFTETVEYTKERMAFGQPIGTFQHNKFLLAELATSLDVATTYLDRCIMAHTRGELTAVDAAGLKWWSADVQNTVIDHCVQLHGGYGYMNEYRVARAWRDARVSKIWGGTNEIMKEIVSRNLGL